MRQLFYIILLLGFCVPVFADQLTVTDAWIKNLPPVVPVRAGYLTIQNRSTSPATIVSVSSPQFKKIEIHHTKQKDGMMSMQHQPVLNIAPGETSTLRQGGMHLMLMNPENPLKPGDKVSVVLHFKDASTQTITMTVKP